MAVEMFLKLDGVQGDPSIKGEIQVLSFSWGLTQTLAQTPGVSSGKPNVSDLSIVKYIDGASPKLMEMCCRGDSSSFATLSLRKAGEKQQDYFKIKLTDVLISSYQTNSTTDGLPMEQLSLAFQGVEVQSAENGQFQAATTCNFAKGH